MTTATQTDRLQTPQIAAALVALPHRIRRVLDSLEQEGKVTVLRACRNRLVHRRDLAKIRAELTQRGWLTTGDEA